MSGSPAPEHPSENPSTTQWLERTDSQVAVHWIHTIDDGANEPAELRRVAVFAPDGTHPLRVTFDSDGFSPAMRRSRIRAPSRSRFGFELVFDPDGTPLEERSFSLHHDTHLVFDGFEPCGPDVPREAPEELVPEALFESETHSPGELPRMSASASLAATIERRHRLLSQSRRLRTIGAASMVLGVGSATTGGLLLDDPFDRGLFAGQGVTIASVGLAYVLTSVRLTRLARP